jgi:hypothetical protein
MADGILKVGQITNSAGSGNITIGSGVTLQNNVPAFAARNSAAQALASATFTLLEFDTEIFDSDGTYTNSSTFKFTPAIAGKYFIYCSFDCDSISDEKYVLLSLYKNGSAISSGGDAMKSINFSAKTDNNQTFLTAIVDANTTDYYQMYGYQNDSGSKNTRTDYGNIFMAYKLGA